MTFSITIPFWLYGLALPIWVVLGFASFYIGGALYAWFGIDQKAKFSDALFYQLGRWDRLLLCVPLWPLAWLEIAYMFLRRWRDKPLYPARWAR